MLNRRTKHLRLFAANPTRKPKAAANSADANVLRKKKLRIMTNISEIRIRGLFGENNYNIRLKDNHLILVSENGSGKTTIVNMIYYFLSRQWSRLRAYDFNSIEAMINGENIKISKDEIDLRSSKHINRILKRYPLKIQKEVELFLNRFDFSDLSRHRFDFEHIFNNYNIPRSVFFEIINYTEKEQIDLFENTLKEKKEKMENLVTPQILYLPTYRRIEQDLRIIFPDLDEELGQYKSKRRRFQKLTDSNAYVELVEFGMEDVENKVKSKLGALKDDLNFKLKNDLTGKYLRDVINENYKNISYNEFQAFSETAFSNIISRIDDTVLSKNEKERLNEFVKEINQTGTIGKEENKIIAHFIYRLSEVYNEIKRKEEDIVKFIEVCNGYSNNKKFVYDNINFEIKIHPIRDLEVQIDKQILFRDLSSGEKQIVSLFSHLFLSDQSDYFVIIDEPELSLSVPWQQRFLADISDNEKCSGILAVTHSPFIFENKLEKFAHGLNEFIV